MTPEPAPTVSPMTPADPSTLERKISVGKLRDSGLIKYPPDYSEVWTQDHGKEVVPVAEGKQVKPFDGIEQPPVEGKYVAVPHDEKETMHSVRGGDGEEGKIRENRKCCGIALKWIVILAIVILLLAVGLGVGLGLGLKKKGPNR